MKKTILILLACLLTAASAYAQNIKVTGVVRDDKGEPLVGANVVAKAKGSAKVVAAETVDITGSYSISCPADATLEFYFLGFETVSEPIKGRKTMDVQMLPDAAQTLDETVVIGYGAVKMADLTGSVTNVKMSELRDAPVASIDQALQGKVAGLDVMSSDGEPGAESLISIRGTRSLAITEDTSSDAQSASVGAPTAPLIVVDGVMDAVSSLNDINPADIEAISVLKDASATAIYGSRGSNGVIIITTKGTSEDASVQQITVNLRAQAGVSMLPRDIDIMNATEYAHYRNQYLQYSGTSSSMDMTTPVSGLSIKNPLERGKGTDWIKSVSRVAPYQNYNLSINGFQGKSKFYASLSYNDEQGIIVKSGKQNYTATLNLSNKVFKWLTLSANLRYQWRTQQEMLTRIGGAGIYSSAIYMSPLINPANNVNKLDRSGATVSNPVAQLDHKTKNTNRSILNATFGWSAHPIGWLRWKGKLSYYYFDRNKYYYEDGALPSKTEGQGGYATRENYGEQSLYLENSLEFSKEFGKHHMDVLLGQTAKWYTDQTFYLSGNGYLVDENKWNNMNAVVDKNTYNADTDKTLKTLLAFFARVNYNWKKRYYLTVTGRFDGASHFAKNQKWGFFPSVAVKWNIANEPFMKRARQVDNLSIRFSAGRSGNDLKAAYRSLARLNTTTSGWLFGGSQPVAYYQDRLASPELTWEKTDEYNLALDGSFFNSKLSFTLEGYISKTKDLLMSIQVPEHTGYGSRYGNLGRTTSSGVELTINSRNIVKRGFSWLSTFTFAHNTSVVDALGSESYVATRKAPAGGYMTVGYKVGYPVNSFWGFQYAGVWHNTEEVERNKVTHAFVDDNTSDSAVSSLGYPRYVDQNHDGKIDNDDIVYLGSPDPVLAGGIQNTFNIHGFSINIFFAWSLGGKVFNYSEYYMAGSRRTNQYRYMINAWHPIMNPESDLPRAGKFDGNAMPSSFMVHDASFLRLKTVSLGYTFNLKAKWIRELNLNLSGENLWLWSTYNGFDPDCSYWGTRRYDLASYPKPMRVVFSVSLKY